MSPPISNLRAGSIAASPLSLCAVAGNRSAPVGRSNFGGTNYAAYPDRLALLEEPNVGHSVTDKMWSEGAQWLLRHLVEKPVRNSK